MTTVTNNQPADLDALDAAMAPPPPVSLERTYFGQVAIVDAWNCVLQKGVGKIPFDPGIHSPQQKAVAVKLSVACEGQNSSYSIDQDVTTSSKEWREFTLPSIQKLGLTLRQLLNQFTQVKRVPTGERYQNKTSGEWKDKTAFVFMATFPDQETMTAAADLFYTPRSQRTDQTDATPAYQPAPAAVTPPAVPAVNLPDRASAAQFLGILWAQAKQDANKFLEMIETNPMLAPHFHSNVTVPELEQFLGSNYIPF